MEHGVLLIDLGVLPDGVYFLRFKRPDNFGRMPQRQVSVRDHRPLQKQRAGSDHAVGSDFTAIQQNSAHADQGASC